MLVLHADWRLCVLAPCKDCFTVVVVERFTSTSGRNLLPAWYSWSVTLRRLTWPARTCVTDTWRSHDAAAADERLKCITNDTTIRNGTRLVRQNRSSDYKPMVRQLSQPYGTKQNSNPIKSFICSEINSCWQWVTSIFDLTFAEPIRWAKVRSKYILSQKVKWFRWAFR